MRLFYTRSASFGSTGLLIKIGLLFPARTETVVENDWILIGCGGVMQYYCLLMQKFNCMVKVLIIFKPTATHNSFAYSNYINIGKWNMSYISVDELITYFHTRESITLLKVVYMIKNCIK